MLYDLNIAWSPHTSAADLERTLRFSASLGYDVIALNHTIGAPVPPQITNPLPKYDSASPQSTTATTATTKITTPPAKLPTVLRRATLVLTESSQNHRIPQLAAAYDILAVRPQTDESFTAACQSLDIALISLDLTTRHHFVFRPKPCMFAVNRGVRFEVCYSQVLQGPAPAHVIPKGGRDTGSNASGAGIPPPVDARARAAFIGNVASLIRATRGRGIVISSEARSVLGLRGPADVVNLLHVWGLPTDQATEGLRALPRGVVVNEGLKRSSFRGVVDIIGHAERSGQGDVEMGGVEQNAQTTKDKRNDKKKNREGNDANGKKRKGVDEDGDASTPANAQGVTKPGGEGEEQQPVSKRQVKKMKAALRRKQAEDEATGA
ncbi:RNase P subunit p30 [Xylaria sp. CBS 124048]|nr:RNase P subunit p30 [Xylaria sp. CBS 124048]